MGVNHFWPCSSLILLGKKTMLYCKITCCFFWMSKTHCRWRTKSIRHKFYKVRACVSVNLKSKKKKKKKSQDGRARCQNNYSSSMSFFNQTWLVRIFIFWFFVLEKKKKKKGWHVPLVVSCHFILTLWAERGVAIVWPRPRIISTWNNIPIRRLRLKSHNAKPDPLSFECFFTVRVCNCECVCLIVEKCTNQIRYKIWYSMPLFFSMLEKNLYIFIGIDIVLPSVFLRCFCTIFVPKMEIVQRKCPSISA